MQLQPTVDISKVCIGLLITVLIGTLLTYSLMIRTGHYWGDDFAQYILHAKNIAEGRPYTDTGYVYDRLSPEIGPRAYPPVFPLLLSPVYSRFGLDLKKMKLEIVLLSIGFLALLFLTFRRKLTCPELLILVVLVAANPYYFRYKDEVVADIPFLFFVFLCFYLVNEAEGVTDLTGKQLFPAILTGLSLYLAYGTRTLGIMLVPALFLSDWARWKRLRRFSLCAVGFAIFLICLQNLWVHTEASYADQLAIHVATIKTNLGSYSSELSAILAAGYDKTARIGLFVVASLLALVGYFWRLRHDRTIIEAFLFSYLAVILLWSNQGARLLIPVFPIYLFYALFGMRKLREHRPGTLTYLLCFLLLMVVSGAYAREYVRMDYGEIREGIAKRESVDLFRFVRQTIPREQLVIFRKPRALALYGNVRASGYHKSADSDLWNYFREIKASYLITGIVDEPFLPDLVRRHADCFQGVYSNRDFTVYRILSCRFEEHEPN